MYTSTISRGRSRVYAAATTRARRTYARMDAAPSLFSPLSLRLPPAPGKDPGAPSSSGHLPPRGSRYQARFGRSPPLQFDAERLTVSCPDNELKPYGAPSVERRGGGKPRRGAAFKGTGARYQGLWSACMARVTNPNAGVMYQAFNARRYVQIYSKRAALLHHYYQRTRYVKYQAAIYLWRLSKEANTSSNK